VIEYGSTDNAGNEEQTKTVEFSISESDPDAPTVEGFADPSTGAAPLLVQFSATGRDPQNRPILYEWDFGDGGGTAGSSPRHTYTTPGRYTATVTVTDQQGKTGTDSVEVVVTGDGNQPPVVVAAATPDEGVAPLEVSFSADALDPDGDARDIIYWWDFGDGGADAFGREVQHTYRTKGTYTATVTATDSGGAFDTDTVVIEVGDPPGNAPPEVRVAATPRSGTAPLTVSFSSQSSDPDGDQLTHRWTFGDGATAGGPGPLLHTYAAAGSYTATLTVNDGEHSASESVVITVGAAGAAPPAGSPPQVGVQGESRSRPSIRAPKAKRARSVVKRGLRLSVGCEETCRARSVLRISGERVGASKRLRIRAGDSRTLVARLKRNVRRNLLAAMRQAGLKRVTLTAITTIATEDGRRAFPVKVVIRR
jgi:PKD repeat protein